MQRLYVVGCGQEEKIKDNESSALLQLIIKYSCSQLTRLSSKEREISVVIPSSGLFDVDSEFYSCFFSLSTTSLL